MIRFRPTTAFFASTIAALSVVLTPTMAAAAVPPIYLVVDTTPKEAPDPATSGGRRVVLVRAFDDGDAGACAQAQKHYPNSPASGTVSRCVPELPAELAPLPHDAAMSKAYVLKFITPGAPGASYRAMFDMSTKDPQQVCHNLVDYQQRYGRLPPNTRVICWVPRG
jgi:hypothetical protein